MFGFLARLLSGPRRNVPDAVTEAALAAVRAAAKPTILLESAQEGMTAARIGGLPHLPADCEWPRRDGHPLSFIAEIDLAAVHRSTGPEWLPAGGYLHVFYDADAQPWGLYPADQTGWKIVLTDHRSEQPLPAPIDLKAGLRFNERSLSARRSVSYPEPERLSVVDYDFEAMENLLERPIGVEPGHRIGGYPSPVQNDTMELEAQLASNGVDLSQPEAYHSPETKSLEAGADAWRLLLQVDSDDDAGMMWCDSGRLYFWVREQDACIGDFSRVWTILQTC